MPREPASPLASGLLFINGVGRMASPQKEKGHTELSNELLEAIIRFPFESSDYKIMLHTIRKTYGYQKKEDCISIGQYQKATGLARRTVIDCLNRLVRYNALVKRTDTYISRYGVQKDYDKWVVRQTALVQSSAKTSAVEQPKLVRQTAPTIEIKKTKERDIKNLIEKGKEQYYLEKEKIQSQSNSDGNTLEPNLKGDPNG